MNHMRRALLVVISLTLLLAGCSQPDGQEAPRTSLQGVITDPSGAPVASAAVTLNPVGDQETSGILRTTSDQAGAYSFITADAGTYNLLVTTGDGRGSFKADITITGTATVTVNIEVTPLGAISGVATLEGRPADSAGIDVYIPGTSFLAKTADNGNFRLGGVPAGTYDVYADAPGHKRATAAGVAVTTGTTTSLPATITLEPENYAPQAAFTAQLDGNTLTVDASSSTDQDGSIISYAWYFGDGTTGSGAIAQHTYSTVGTKAVTLTVTDNGGRTSSLTKQVEVVEIQPIVQQLEATTNASTPITSVDLVPGGTAHFEITVDSTVSTAGTALYIELNDAFPMEVVWQGDTYYSSSSDYFSLNPVAPAASGLLKPNDISVSVMCRGSCVIVESVASSALVSVTNPTATTATFDLFAFTQDFQDTNEPGNDAPSGAVQLQLNIDEIGALELIGDVDYFLVDAAGTVSFVSISLIEMVAHVHDASGQRLSGPFSPGSQFHVEAGEYIRVEAATQTAAASANSLYFLMLE